MQKNLDNYFTTAIDHILKWRSDDIQKTFINSFHDKLLGMGSRSTRKNSTEVTQWTFEAPNGPLKSENTSFSISPEVVYI